MANKGKEGSRIVIQEAVVLFDVREISIDNHSCMIE